MAAENHQHAHHKPVGGQRNPATACPPQTGTRSRPARLTMANAVATAVLPPLAVKAWAAAVAVAVGPAVAMAWLKAVARVWVCCWAGVFWMSWAAWLPKPAKSWAVMLAVLREARAGQGGSWRKVGGGWKGAGCQPAGNAGRGWWPPAREGRKQLGCSQLVNGGQGGGSVAGRGRDWWRGGEGRCGRGFASRWGWHRRRQRGHEPGGDGRVGHGREG